MSLEEMISYCSSGHSSTDDDHISIARNGFCSPMPDQWVTPRTLEPKREGRLGMRKPSSRSISDRVHLDGTGKVAARDRGGSGIGGGLQGGRLEFSTHNDYTKVRGCVLSIASRGSVLVHCLCVLVLTQLE